MVGNNFTDVTTGEDSFIQVNMLKGTYHNNTGKYNSNLTDAIAIVLNHEKNENISKTIMDNLNNFQRLDAEISSYQDSLRQSENGLIYLDISKKRLLAEDLIIMKTDSVKLRHVLIQYLIKSMAEHKILEKEITPMILEKLPMFFRGGFRKGESDDPSETEEIDTPLE